MKSKIVKRHKIEGDQYKALLIAIHAQKAVHDQRDTMVENMKDNVTKIVKDTLAEGKEMTKRAHAELWDTVHKLGFDESKAYQLDTTYEHLGYIYLDETGEEMKPGSDGDSRKPDVDNIESLLDELM